MRTWAGVLAVSSGQTVHMQWEQESVLNNPQSGKRLNREGCSPRQPRVPAWDRPSCGSVRAGRTLPCRALEALSALELGSTFWSSTI